MNPGQYRRLSNVHMAIKCGWVSLLSLVSPPSASPLIETHCSPSPWRLWDLSTMQKRDLFDVMEETADITQRVGVVVVGAGTVPYSRVGMQKCIATSSSLKAELKLLLLLLITVLDKLPKWSHTNHWCKNASWKWLSTTMFSAALRKNSHCQTKTSSFNSTLQVDPNQQNENQ